MGILADTFRARLQELQQRDAELQADLDLLIRQTHAIIDEMEAMETDLDEVLQEA